MKKEILGVGRHGQLSSDVTPKSCTVACLQQQAPIRSPSYPLVALYPTTAGGHPYDTFSIV